MRILVAGGGSGGHVVPALAVSAELKRRGAEVRFVGSRRPDDRRLVEAAGFPFEAISTGKFRRYFSLQTFLEPFRAYAGYRQSLKIVRRFRPDVVFAKGGFVAVPVMRAAKRLKVPIVLHESDMVPGLANRIGAKYASAIAVSFPPDRMSWQTKRPVVYTGNPIAEGLTTGSAERARKRFGLSSKDPVLLVLGGSQGSVAVNQLVFDALPELLPEVQIVHQVGVRSEAVGVSERGKLPEALRSRYHSRGYFSNESEIPGLYAVVDLVVARAGAGVLAGIAATGAPSILIPLPSAASDHQRANASVFEGVGAALVLEETDLGAEELARAVKKLLHDPTRRSRMARAAKSLAKPGAAAAVADLVWKAGKESHA